MVLLIVVVMLAITCVMLVQIATLSFGRVRDTVRIEQQIQQRWSIVSLRRSGLRLASSLLTDAEREQAIMPADTSVSLSEPQTKRTFRVTVNQQLYRVSLSDESAKLPLNSLAAYRQDITIRSANKLLQPTGVRIPAGAFDRIQGETSSWFDWAATANGVPRALPMEALGDQITLWGSGRLNIFRAREDTLQEAWRIVFGRFPPSELRAARASFPRPGWNAFRESLGLREAELEKFERYFSGDSDCFSITIASQTRSGAEAGGWMFIDDRGWFNHGMEF